MSENEIKPVAWVERNENGHDRMWSYSLESWVHRPANPEPLYDQSAIDRLTAERDAAVADAERYRWLRDNCQEAADYYATTGQLYFGTYGYSGIDAAIDAARAEGRA